MAEERERRRGETVYVESFGDLGDVAVTIEDPGDTAPCEYVIELRRPGEDPEPICGIKFQLGPVREAGLNGATNEALIAVVLDRLRAFQGSPFACRFNALAITKLEEATMWLEERTRERKRRGVEGTSRR